MVDTQTDKRFNSKPERIRRTGEKTFDIEHDDGSRFECVEKVPGMAAKLDGVPPPGDGKSFAGAGPGNKDMTNWEEIGPGKYRLKIK